MTSKLLITGSSGFLGSRAKTYFTQKGFQVFSPSHHELDLLHEESISQYIEQVSPDYLIHCAAISDTGYCQEHGKDSYAMNVKAVESIAKACGRAGTKLAFCSSDQIYFGSPVSSTPHTEDESVTPANLYVWAVIENLEKALILPGGIYNFGAENSYTTYDTVRILFDKKGIAAKHLSPNEEAFRDNPRNIAMNMDKLRAHGIDFDATLPMLIKYW